MGATILFTICLLPLFSLTNGRIIKDCDLVQELNRADVEKDLLPDWVCLVNSESGGNTRLVTGHIANCFGIFQICSNKWCTRGRKGGVCNARCEDFLDNDIQDDIACAQKIYETDGFKAFRGWNRKCKGKKLPNVEQQCSEAEAPTTWVPRGSSTTMSELIEAEHHYEYPTL